MSRHGLRSAAPIESSAQDPPSGTARWGPARIGPSVRANAALVAIGAVGLVLRVLTSVTYRPALAFVQDTFDYLENAAVLQPGLVRPSGYPAFLRILSVAGSIAVIPVVQHVLGLSTGVLLYALLRRLGVGAWMAALGAAPVLLDSYQI